MKKLGSVATRKTQKTLRSGSGWQRFTGMRLSS
jgi:hypothetical protein